MSAGLPARMTRERRQILAIPVGAVRREFVLTRFQSLRSSPGWIAGADGTLREWRLQGFFKEDGELYLYGGYLEGRSLEEALEADPQQTLADLGALVRALLALKAGGKAIPVLQTDSVRLLASGEVLFLPPEIMDKVTAFRPLSHRLRVRETIRHPDLDDPGERASFSIAALLYRTIRGVYPFQATEDEELHNQVRHLKLAPLRLQAPGVKEEVDRAVMAGLQRGGGSPPSLEEWAALLEGWAREGLYRTLTDEERRSVEREAARERERAEKGYRRHVFWQRNWKTVVIVAAAVVVAGVLGGSYLRNLLAPRPTRGFTPRQVVETFYESMNSLDHTMMEACVVKGAGKQVIREVVNLYVLSRVSMGYEGRSNIVSAARWDQEGRPAIYPPETVYGVTDLEVRQESPPPEPVFRVSYVKWAPLPGEPPAGEAGAAQAPREPNYRGTPMVERVHLTRDHGDWVIDRIERLEGSS